MTAATGSDVWMLSLTLRRVGSCGERSPAVRAVYSSLLVTAATGSDVWMLSLRRVGICGKRSPAVRVVYSPLLVTAATGSDVWMLSLRRVGICGERSPAVRVVYSPLLVTAAAVDAACVISQAVCEAVSNNICSPSLMTAAAANQDVSCVT